MTGTVYLLNFIRPVGNSGSPHGMTQHASAGRAARSAGSTRTAIAGRGHHARGIQQGIGFLAVGEPARDLDGDEASQEQAAELELERVLRTSTSSALSTGGS